MKKFTFLLLTAICLFCNNLSFAQTPGIVGTNAFFAGQWLEAGEQSNGDFGCAASSVPVGYHPHCAGCSSGNGLALIYDFGHDGWLAGTPAYMGDYTYAGSPFEGWEIQYGVTGTAKGQAFCTGGTTGSYTNVGGAGLTGAITSFTDIGGRQIATWSGTASGGNLQIIQQTELDTFASWILMTVKMYNVGTSAIDSIYFLRSNDPDNNETWAGSAAFTSENYIDYQNDVDHRVQVRATSSTPAPGNQYPMALCTKDSRAVAFIYDDWPMSAAQNLTPVWDKTYAFGTSWYQVNSSPDVTEDAAIGLVFNIGTILPGDSAIFSYAYTFNGASGIDSAFPANNLAGIITGPNTLCAGFTTTLSDDTTGGTWSSSATAVAIVGSSGIVTGLAAGTATISYTVGSSFATFAVTVYPVPSISTPPLLCVGGTDTLTATPGGGTWSTASVMATLGSATGAITGVAAGTALISYTALTGCATAVVVTVDPALSTIAGPLSLCEASTITLTDATAGGTWSSSTTGVAPVGSATGIVGGIAAGTSAISYVLSPGCTTSAEVTVYPLPVLNISTSGTCGPADTLTASVSGGGTCTWAPGTGLSCVSCDTTIASIVATTTYTVSSTSSFACTITDTVNINGNRISGFITMTTTPTDTLKVWLIQFNPIDSTLTAEDSMLTCMDGGIPYYEFDNEPAGSYMVKAKLLSSVAGTSGYVPTYGLSTIHWDTAATITHINATDTQHINMIYGLVPPGPGFIGGLISAGAGRGTSAVIPIVGMLVYIQDASGNIITYTYTNTAGLYSFSGLSNGTYTVYPVDYHYNTIPWSNIVINAGADTFTTIDFYQYNTMQIITPDSSLATSQMLNTTKLSIFPNPTTTSLSIIQSPSAYTTFTITNSIGQNMMQQSLTTTQTQVNIATLPPGLYYITFRGDNGTSVQKFVKM